MLDCWQRAGMQFEDNVSRFRVGTAIAQGLSPAQLASSRYRRPFHGVRAIGDAPAYTDRAGRPLGRLESQHLERALDYVPRMPDEGFLSHVTAAVLWELPLPLAALADQRVHVAVPPSRRLPRGAGVRGHEVSHRLTAVVRHPIWGVPVSTPESTWASLAAVLADDRDLIAAADAAVRTWRVDSPLATVRSLERAVAAGRRVGIARLREALPRVRCGSASRPESWLRLLLVDAGLPEPELNADIPVAGGKLAGDLVYRRQRVVVEYEGEHHLLDPAQWASDIERYERLAAAGWIVIRITKTDLFAAPTSVVDRVRRALVAR